MLEKSPLVTDALSPRQIIQLLSNPKHRDLLLKIEKDYPYWDKIKYLGTKELPSETLWQIVKFSRLSNANFIKFGDYTFIFKISNYIQQLLHEFDMNFGGIFSASTIMSEKNKQYYLLSSIMEEAIASSQMEGASTTRKVAKEMLRKYLELPNGIPSTDTILRVLAGIDGKELEKILHFSLGQTETKFTQHSFIGTRGGQL